MEKQFTKLTKKEIINTNGGIFGIDDAVFWPLLVESFGIGFSIGTTIKQKKEKQRNK